VSFISKTPRLYFVFWVNSLVDSLINLIIVAMSEISIGSLEVGKRLPIRQFRLEEIAEVKDFGSYTRYEWKVTVIGADGKEEAKGALYTSMSPDELKVDADTLCVTNAKLQANPDKNGKYNYLVPKDRAAQEVPERIGFAF
jgi:hypothetical protein